VAGEAAALCRQGNRAALAVPPSTTAGASAQRAVDLREQALGERRGLLAAVAANGGQNADVWCKTCLLSTLPRKEPIQ
jgi:hypothetical protein